MKKKFVSSIKTFLSTTTSGGSSRNDPATCLNVHEEYAQAFRTESYNDFWTHVLALSNKTSATCISPMDSTTADRLSSYRLFAEQLLDPDQPTVNRILASAHNPPKAHSLLSEYFSLTANASVICGLLLKNVDRIRIRHRSSKSTIQTLKETQFTHSLDHLKLVTQLVRFSNSPNPFSSLTQVQVVQFDCSELFKQLESSRNKAQAKLRLMSRLQHGSGMLLVALTTSLVVIVASHALALLVGAPGLIVASLELGSRRRLLKVSARLDAAAKGTYILSRDLDTIGRLVARLKDGMEDMRTMVKFWVDRGEDHLQASGEVVRQLKKNDASFSEKLDELEEHLYLCLMTINRARTQVLKEISGSSHIH